MCVTSEINDLSKSANLANNDASDVEFSSLDSGVDGKHNGICFVGISKRFVMHDTFYFKTKPFETVYNG